MIDKDNPKREHGLYSPAAKPTPAIWSDEFKLIQQQKHKEKQELDRSLPNEIPFMLIVFSIIDNLYEIKDENEFKKQKNVANLDEFKLIQQQKRTDRYKRLIGNTDLYRTQDDLDEIELEKQKNAAYLKLAFDRNPELKKKHNFWSNCKLLTAVWFVTLLVAVWFPFPDVLINFAHGVINWTCVPTLAIGGFSICKEVYVNEKALETLSESDKEKVLRTQFPYKWIPDRDKND